jgi:hypothetical protein
VETFHPKARVERINNRLIKLVQPIQRMMRRLNRCCAQAGISPMLMSLVLIQPAHQAKALPNPAGQSTITMPTAGVVWMAPISSATAVTASRYS